MWVSQTPLPQMDRWLPANQATTNRRYTNTGTRTDAYTNAHVPCAPLGPHYAPLGRHIAGSQAGVLHAGVSQGFWVWVGINVQHILQQPLLGVSRCANQSNTTFTHMHNLIICSILQTHQFRLSHIAWGHHVTSCTPDCVFGSQVL